MRQEEFEKEYRNSLEEIKLPDAIKQKLRCIGCLKEREDICTLLMQDCKTDKKYTLKIAQNERIYAVKREKQVLDELLNRGIRRFPTPVLSLQENHVMYYLREYIDGESLVSLVKRKGCMQEKVLLWTGIQLCELLEILHRQDPPIIHRDVKPENIIVTKNRHFTLIDFETARRYSHKKDKDTLVMGSRLTAAPEQFGFSQSDCRTDIYGLGMTLLYLVCGTYDKEDLGLTEISPETRKVICKAVSFTPEKRYRSVACMKRALIKCRRKMQKKGCV